MRRPGLGKCGPPRSFYVSAGCGLVRRRGKARNPLTWPAPAEENAGAVHPLPQGGEGRFFDTHSFEFEKMRKLETLSKRKRWPAASAFTSRTGPVQGVARLPT